jgi:triosephosphate isomerase (TIM)
MNPVAAARPGRAGRTPLIVGNWKCHLTLPEALALVSEVKIALGDFQGVEVVVAPPFTALAAVTRRLDGTAIALAAQNCHHVDYGPYTGEVSAPMIKDAGCRYVILGHSERRQWFRETDDNVAAKLRAALRAGLCPILCVGETAEERDAGRTNDRLRAQLEAALVGVHAPDMRALAVAYEPVWAIGTGRNATPQQAQTAHSFLRGLLRGRYAEAALGVRILYGGSVRPDNVAALMSGDDVDGALVGGASLQAREFIEIVRNAKGAAR